MEHMTDEQLHLYLDGELDAQEHAQAKLHLMTCTACQRELAQLSDLFTMIQEAPAIERRVDLAPAVLAAIRTAPQHIAPQRQASDSATWPFRAWAALIAQLTCAIALGVWSIPILAAAIARIEAGIPLIRINPNAILGANLPIQRSVAALPRMLDIPIPAPFSQLGLIEWVTIAVLVCIIWLICNHILLNMPRSAQAGQREVAS